MTKYEIDFYVDNVFHREVITANTYTLAQNEIKLRYRGCKITFGAYNIIR